MYTSVQSFCQSLEKEFDNIPESRKEQLLPFARYLRQKIDTNQTIRVIIVCTHNSRRSHIGQICLALAASYYDIHQVETFSGGTESTAFNTRAVDAFRRIGVNLLADNTSDINPIYELKWDADMKPYKAFSKKINHPTNPKQDFAAIMVCNQADEACPIVPGCDFRLALPYTDPKEYDDTPKEALAYDDKIREIGREMFFVVKHALSL